MLTYNDITEGKYIVIDGSPYEVISSHVFRKQQRKPVNATKLKNMLTGKVTERSFHQSEKVDEADISIHDIKYLYSRKGENWFCDADNPRNRFPLSDAVVGTAISFIKENTLVEGLYFGDEIIGVRVPIKTDLEVTSAPPAVKGNTATGGTKLVTLETGATVNVPLFINEGDIVRINTSTGEYVERVKKQ